MSFVKAQKARQKPHRERAQPSERESLGFLEKKKDYKKRAKNYHNKEKQLKALRKKVQAKNPDEFYFKMIHKKVQDDGVHWLDDEKPEETLTAAQRALMESQDLNYVKWKLQIEKQKIKRLSKDIICDHNDSPKKQHIIFVDKHSDRKDDSDNDKKYRLKISTNQKKRKTEIEQRKVRAKELQAVVDKMTTQRNISYDKSNDRKLVKCEDKDSAAIYQWKPMRSK